MTATAYREPLLWVTSTSSWEDEALIARLLPPAAVLPGDVALAEVPVNPYLVVVARETQPSCEVLLRQFGMVTDTDGTTRQNVADGWTIAATILLATAPGKQEKEFRNYAAALTDDPKRVVMRVPFMRSWRLSPIAELPRWDFTSTVQGRGRTRPRTDGLPAVLADGFSQIMSHVAHLRDQDKARTDDTDTGTQQCA
ncbi:hypothetical protein FOV72_19700 [Gordonia rubripertincta]|uniref:hypothetical protein n=1 Tax=Gordonia rubripertincta TaxID=36822 RepID=UPI001180D652|nr:hypothetical protein [Gordonia rubripertincta]TSD93487.1 hypothetical protein FOV72_19700 [Gordonia rubripertincta]